MYTITSDGTLGPQREFSALDTILSDGRHKAFSPDGVRIDAHGNLFVALFDGGLRKHGMAVSVCTEAYGVMEAERLGLSGAEAAEFVELYASAGLLHDMDYERHPTQEEHPFVGVKHLREQGWPERVCCTRFWRMRIIRAW